jgi:hypothetical protein
MSSSFRSRRAAAGRTAATAAAAFVVGMMSASAPGNAAEIWYQPLVQLSTAYNTNVDLEPTGAQAAEGYYADASTLIGIATPNSETTLTPRLLYNYYPSIQTLNRLEGFLNLASRYAWRRNRFNIYGFFDHRDDSNAEQPAATEPDPTQGGNGTTTPSSGRVTNDTVRNWLVLDPTFIHLLTPLSSIGVGGEYQKLSYSPEDTSSHIPFNYYMGKVFYGWTQTPRLDFTAGVFGSRYLAGTIDSRSTSGGVNGSMTYSWTQTLQTQASASYERVHFTETDPHDFDQTSNQWAASLSTTYNGVLSKYRASIGRSIVPGSNGGLFLTDQVQGQYDRDLTARLHVTGAIRYFRDRIVSSPGTSATRDYLTPFFKIQYMVTRRMFVAGTYTYVWQKYNTDPTGAAANRVGVSFGYQGLPKQ